MDYTYGAKRLFEQKISELNIDRSFLEDDIGGYEELQPTLPKDIKILKDAKNKFVQKHNFLSLELKRDLEISNILKIEEVIISQTDKAIYLLQSLINYIQEKNRLIEQKNKSKGFLKHYKNNLRNLKRNLGYYVVDFDELENTQAEIQSLIHYFEEIEHKAKSKQKEAKKELKKLGVNVKDINKTLDGTLQKLFILKEVHLHNQSILRQGSKLKQRMSRLTFYRPLKFIETLFS